MFAKFVNVLNKGYRYFSSCHASCFIKMRLFIKMELLVLNYSYKINHTLLNILAIFIDLYHFDCVEKGNIFSK